MYFRLTIIRTPVPGNIACVRKIPYMRLSNVFWPEQYSYLVKRTIFKEIVVVEIVSSQSTISHRHLEIRKLIGIRPMMKPNIIGNWRPSFLY